MENQINSEKLNNPKSWWQRMRGSSNNKSSDDKTDKSVYKPTEKEIINEIFKSEGTNLIRKATRCPGVSNSTGNSFNQSDSEYLTSVFLSLMGNQYQFEVDRMRNIIKNLLKDDYEISYDRAKNNLTRQPSRVDSKPQIEENANNKPIKEVINIMGLHSTELDELWENTSSEELKGLFDTFFLELGKEWPNESAEFSLIKPTDDIAKGFCNCIKAAYAAGYVRGKGYISSNQMAAYLLYTGDFSEKLIKSRIKGAKSKGTGLASGYAAVGVKGHIRAVSIKT